MKITQVRSANGTNPNQKATLKALGLGRIGKAVERKDSPQLQGQLRVVSHLVEVEVADGRDSRASEEIGLHNLKPKPGSRTAAQADRPRRGQRRSARPPAAATRAPARARARKRKAGYEGGQNPIHMRMRKLRGPHMKKSMPFENFRTKTQPVNLADLEERFDAGAEVTPETLKEKGLAKRSDPVKILARGEISKKLTVHAHGFSAAAKEKIEAAGGSCHTLEP